VVMPLLNGFQASRQILDAAPDTKVLMLSSFNEEEYIEESIKAGAMGYLIKQNAADTLCAAIREVQDGSKFLRPPGPRRRRLKL
jgi:two-component system response regulator DegU